MNNNICYYNMIKILIVLYGDGEPGQFIHQYYATFLL